MSYAMFYVAGFAFLLFGIALGMLLFWAIWRKAILKTVDKIEEIQDKEAKQNSPRHPQVELYGRILYLRNVQLNHVDKTIVAVYETERKN